MTKLTEEVGQKIKFFRKKKGLTLEALASAICKSKATVCKYENGNIAVDIVTLYDISHALGIHVEQLLYAEPGQPQPAQQAFLPTFFKNLTQFYIYLFDGRSNQINICVADILSQTEPNVFKVMMYMNISGYDTYQYCENTYWGYLKHYDAVSNLILYNQDTPMEQLTISVLASYLDAPTKWALFFGISSRPLMPIAMKVLISKKRLPQTAELEKKLHISKEDIRLLKLYNMLSAT